MDLKPLHSPKACILVLEQDPFLRAGLCSVLSAAGHRLAGAEAAAGVRIDLVLAGLEGRSCLLQRPDYAVPVILLVDRTAWTGLDFLDAANALGATAVLQRPFSRATLLCLIARVLASRPGAARPVEVAGLPDLLPQSEKPSFV